MNNYIIAALGVVSVIATGCSNTIADVTNSQAKAVTAAVNATCDRYNACSRIGAGKTYENRDACDKQARDFWNDQWTVAKCEGNINGDSLTVCTDRISATNCDSFVDKLQTVYGSCATEDVCR